MKRIIIVALMVVMAMGQALSQEIQNRAEYNLNQNRALWYNSGNAAGLAREQMRLWRDVALSYNLQTGNFTDSWGARTVSGFSLGGDMLMDIEGFTLAAKVSLERNRLFNCAYNTSLYEVTWDMPFFVATNTSESFPWRHSEVGMEVAAATPLMLDGQLSAGMALRTQGRSALKSVDPRSRYGDFDMELAPSATFLIDDENLVGMTLRYRFCPAKTTLTSGAETPVRVSYMEGLGAYNSRWIGGDIGTERLNYISNRFGVDLQYNRTEESRQWLFALSFDTGDTRVNEMDLPLGRVYKYVIGTNVQGLFGADRNRKLNFDIDYNRYNWQEEAKGIVGRGGIMDMHADYTIYIGANEDSYDFELGVGLDMSSISVRRIARPEGYFNSFTFLPYAFAGMNTRLTTESNLLARITLGNRYSAKPGYGLEDNSIFMKMYEDEAYYLGRFFYKSAADLEYSFRINTLLATYARLSIGHQMPLTIKGGRLYATLAVGVMF